MSRPLTHAVAIACGAAVLAACTTATSSSAPEARELASFDGPDERAALTADDLDELAFTVELADEVDPGGGDEGEVDDGAFAGAVWTLTSVELDVDGPDGLEDAPAPGEVDGADERDVTDEVAVDGATARWTPDDLDDGRHQLDVALPEVGRGGLEHTWTFAVAVTPPELTITDPDDGVLIASRGLTIAGETTGTEVTLGEQQAEVDGDGTFTLELDEVPEGEVELVATDAWGNTATAATELTVVPSRVETDEIRAIHVTPHAWATPSFRERIIGMIEDELVTAIQLDLKDEGGRIGYRTEVELARESGAAEDVYDLAEAVETLHELGVPVIGRIVAFRDPVIGAYAQGNGDMDWVVQTPEGEPFTSRYGCCFTSFANDEIIEYNLAIAEEAAAMGVDHILWDYIRRPDGSVDNMVYDGLSDDASAATLEEAVVDFTRLADERLAPYGIQHGASLYGIAADRPTQIAQDVAGMSPYLDYVAPMIYPSHWGPGEYGVEDPNRQPYDIIEATLEVWKDAIQGDRVRIVPWLEDTNFRAFDRPFQVREQIRATADAGIDEWLMWDPVVQYTLEAYESRPAD